MWIYGDSIAYDDSADAALLEEYNADADGFAWAGNDAWFYGNEDDYDVELGWKRDFGDDLIQGGHEGLGNLYIVGGYGGDTIFTGADRASGNIYVWGDNRAYYTEDLAQFPGDVDHYGFENDGNDIIDIEDNPGSAIYGHGQGGDDKIIGSVQGASPMPEKLYGGDGDDKIWLLNPGQYEDSAADAFNYGYGGRGNDIIYGDNR